MQFNGRTTPRWQAVLLCLALCVACKPSPPPAARGAAGPVLTATVVTIRTTAQPEKKTWNRSIVIAGDRARITAERDAWRLFDLKAGTVTFVDEVEKTVRNEPLKDLVKRRGSANDTALPAHYPRAELVRSQKRRPMQGVTAESLTIRAGAYERELWMAEHPSIPRGLFAMMHLSEPQTSPLAPMMRAVDDAIAPMPGFPLLDRTVVPLGNRQMVIEHTVTGIVQRQVPESLLAIPKGYRDLTPKPAAKE